MSNQIRSTSASASKVRWSFLVLFSLIFNLLSNNLLLKMAEAKPLVGMQKTPDGEDRIIGVNVPWIYTMDLLTGKKGSDLGINVLSGLVRVNVDSRRKINGRRPVSVSLLGAKLYDSYPSEQESGDIDPIESYQGSASKQSSKVKAPSKPEEESKIV